MPSNLHCRRLPPASLVVAQLMDAPGAPTTSEPKARAEARRTVAARLAREAETTSLTMHPAWFNARALDELDEEAAYAFWFIETFKGRGPELLGQCGSERTIALARLHEHARKQCHEAAVFVRFARPPQRGDREAERERDIDQAIADSEYEYVEAANREAERDEWLSEEGHLHRGARAAARELDAYEVVRE